MIANLEPRIQQITDELLDAVQKKGKMDLIADFAFPLPFRIIAEMLGIPVLYQEKIYDLWVSIKADPNQDHHAWIKEYYSCIRETLEEKRKHPTEGVISSLIHAHDQEDKLSEPELLSTVQLLITAGHETTTNLIGNGMVALQKHPEQLALLRSNPSLLPNAIEELLRYAGPLMISWRFAKFAGFQGIRHASRTLKGIETVHALYKRKRSLQQPNFVFSTYNKLQQLLRIA